MAQVKDIRRFAHWSRTPAADGVLLGHPSGRDHGLVRIRRGLPLRPLAKDIAEACANGFGSADSRGVDVDVRRLLTDDGEHGALIRLRVHPAGDAPFDRHVAVIVGHRAAVRLEGFCERVSQRQQFALDFEGLATCTLTGDASVRQRMFEYQPPHAWHGRRQGGCTVWYPPACPRDQSTLEVFDAIPHDDHGTQLTHALINGNPTGTTAPLTLQHGLSGTAWTGSETTIARVGDGRFYYEIRAWFRSRPVEHQQTFESLLRSVRPVPHASVRAGTDAAVGEFAWVL